MEITRTLVAKLLFISSERLIRLSMLKFGCCRRASSEVESRISAQMVDAIIIADGSVMFSTYHV